SHVVLQHLGSLIRDDQSRVQDAGEWPPSAFHGVDGGNQDVGFHFGHHPLVQDSGRAVRPHATGIWALIIVVGPFVVLRRAEGDQGTTVGYGDHAYFFAIETLFENQAVARRAELAMLGDAIDGVEALFAVRADDDSLA